MSDSPIPWTSTSEMFDQLWSGDTDADLDPATDKVPDTLATIFRQQQRLMVAVWPKELASGLGTPTSSDEWGDLANRRVQARIHEAFGHLVRELSEAMACLDASKSWKDNPRPTYPIRFREEVADALHFFVEFCILSGISAERLFLEYFRKSTINFDRMENKY